MKVKYSYLYEQFKDSKKLWSQLKKFVKTGDFTLGEPLKKFEKKFSKLIGSKYAVGVNSGTDAIKIALKVLGLKPGDEVITAANTFVATVGAINEIGCKPVFVDVDDTFCMNVNLIEKKITKNTKAILPVHYSGYMTDMIKIKKISKKYNLPIIEDACQSILANQNGKNAGTLGEFGTFSLHPLKNLNVWSDGGIITFNKKKYLKKILLLRNHGLVNRDKVDMLAYNSRLDTFQAVVGNWLIPKARKIANQRIKNATFLDNNLKKIKGITIPNRPKNFKLVYHLYMVYAKKRNSLLKYCLKNGIEAKVHYPIPIYKQKALKKIINRKEKFIVTDFQSKNLITFPVHQHLKANQLKYIIKIIKKFYASKKN
tara:strand:+ start:958 stop:2067 length:1110 start_codon:yes stop_codon:yes gene_type:complete